MALSVFIQIYKIFARKSAKDISAITYLILALGGVIWILYGIEINSTTIIIPNSIGVLGSSIIILGWFLYGRYTK